MNKATHPRLETKSEGCVKFVGSRCIKYAVKTPEQLYEEFLAGLPYVRNDAIAAERTKRRKEQDDLLTQAERNPEFRRKIATLREADASSEDGEELGAARRAIFKEC